MLSPCAVWSAWDEAVPSEFVKFRNVPSFIFKKKITDTITVDHLNSLEKITFFYTYMFLRCRKKKKS